MKDWRFKALVIVCTVLLTSTVHAQSLPEVKVELGGGLPYLYGEERILAVSEMAAKGFVGALANNKLQKLKPWTFGTTSSAYKLVLLIEEKEGTPDYYVLKAVLRRDLKGFYETEVGRAVWCKPGDEEEFDVCNHGIMPDYPPSAAAEKIVKRLVTIFDKNSVNELSWGRLISKLEQNIPVAENVQWYNKRLHKPSKRVLLPNFSAVTSISSKNYDFVKGWTPFVWCEELGKSNLALRARWMDSPLQPKSVEGSTGRNENLGLEVWQWQEQPGDWNKLEERKCQEKDYSLREVRFRPFWATENDV